MLQCAKTIISLAITKTACIDYERDEAGFQPALPEARKPAGALRLEAVFEGMTHGMRLAR